MTMQYLADTLGISKERLASYEQGRAEPPVDMLIVFCDYFRISLDAIARTDLSVLNDFSIKELERGFTKDLEGKGLRIYNQLWTATAKKILNWFLLNQKPDIPQDIMTRYI